MYNKVTKRQDGSYVIIKNGLPYHCPNVGEWKEEFKLVDAWAKANPDQVTQEVIPEVTLSDVKSQKIQELKNARDTQEQSGFEYMGVIFDSDSVAFQRMLGADNAALKAQMQGIPFEVNWTVKDNSSLHMTLEQTLGMVPTFAAYSGSLHEKCKLLVAQVEAATTIEAVQTIVWA